MSGRYGGWERWTLLERLCAKEQYEEMVGILTAGQICALLLALEEGMNGEEIAEFLGLTREVVSDRFRGARLLLLEGFPDLDVQGRTRLRGIRKRMPRRANR